MNAYLGHINDTNVLIQALFIFYIQRDCCFHGKNRRDFFLSAKSYSLLKTKM